MLGELATTELIQRKVPLLDERVDVVEVAVVVEDGAQSSRCLVVRRLRRRDVDDGDNVERRSFRSRVIGLVRSTFRPGKSIPEAAFPAS